MYVQAVYSWNIYNVCVLNSCNLYHEPSLTPPDVIRVLYQARKVSNHVYTCTYNGYRLLPLCTPNRFCNCNMINGRENRKDNKEWTI